MNLQIFFDDVLERTLLPFIPRGVSPNQVTCLRILALPFIWYFLANESYAIGFAVSAVAALTDALDGAMARKRNQITELGKVLDAVADRGLITLIALIFIPKFFGWPLFLWLVALEAVNALAAYRARRKLGMNPGANWAGKVKMVLQCAAFGMVFGALLFPAAFWLAYAYWLLVISLFFAFLQVFLYPKTKAAARYA